ncbi:PIN domain-containing protein [Agrobacterium rubi]|uniref:Type II toxin-antitoxin system VapC family toxin n=1 Tax=Agrobacterium rubi TaxID=28099 RepID=A0AAE7UPZ6_9HYPH|nr:type II toxin-antitoxin system VapC family toxin [Agrobacterium rubi]NTE87279.1 type II toxin-antitoxin system VapC family toxin [Agrobacterium rubi]NTF03213.1 type II toxin-antitoxin system VapC family toxin [Agrobacterium rubi]NTF37373.1 type II toxin-antitoxin system VapC family toxin [Agrobacterium rubi]OCJ55074.1 twitching motility protein PilT [Agrobacterium rubi]QTF99786.1 type II toxin-antitoxin system VapC family toxin [Agrobacterium rubi]
MSGRFGIDTNILLHVAVNDDPAQRDRIVNFINELGKNDTLVVGVVVVMETAWVLERFYGYSKDAVLDFIQAILERREIEVPDYEVVGNAIDICRNSGADFSDAVISEMNRMAGCTVTYTFDQKAARKIPGMEMLT